MDNSHLVRFIVLDFVDARVFLHGTIISAPGGRGKAARNLYFVSLSKIVARGRGEESLPSHHSEALTLLTRVFFIWIPHSFRPFAPIPHASTTTMTEILNLPGPSSVDSDLSTPPATAIPLLFLPCDLLFLFLLPGLLCQAPPGPPPDLPLHHRRRIPLRHRPPPRVFLCLHPKSPRPSWQGEPGPPRPPVFLPPPLRRPCRRWFRILRTLPVLPLSLEHPRRLSFPVPLRVHPCHLAP